MSDVVAAADGRRRCPWALSAPDYLAYHDEEWGRRYAGPPALADRAMFERLTLEAFQSGLSWLVILRKRPAFRVAFADFDLATVAGFGPTDVERLLADAGIVRNRAKIEAAIANARAALELPTGLAAHLASYAPAAAAAAAAARPAPVTLAAAARPAPVTLAAAARPAPVTLADVPSQSPESVALAKDLRKRGFRFVGPTTLYALMQAVGLVDDHLADCWCRGA